ncbi:MAG: hypothetical protein Q8J64_03485 [Thermodesulfovibrionales bacterium]|nr:hypothetical protein [Thermodesulfovibrionales bacterium]
MTETKDICAICAWRATCQKMFSVCGRDVRCPDFVKDASIGREAPKEAVKAEETKED